MAARPSNVLTNRCIQTSPSFAPILMHALENVARCSFAVVTPFPENLGKWSLNLGNESVGGGRFNGDLTSQGVASASTSYENIPSFLITF